MSAEIGEEEYERIRRGVMRGRLIRRLDEALASGRVNSYMIEALTDRLERLMTVEQPPVIPTPRSKVLH